MGRNPQFSKSLLYWWQTNLKSQVLLAVHQNYEETTASKITEMTLLRLVENIITNCFSSPAENRVLPIG